MTANNNNIVQSNGGNSVDSVGGVTTFNNVLFR